MTIHCGGTLETRSTSCEIDYPHKPHNVNKAHDWWHARDINHHLVCLDCGLGWHGVVDMSAIVHQCDTPNHNAHYDKCCERDNRCNTDAVDDTEVQRMLMM